VAVADQPCNTAADCAAGLGCIDTPNGGTCQPYCCGDVEACPNNTFCVPKLMAEDKATQIPVCVPTDNCTLLSEHSCSSANPPTPGCCADGLACFIVRGNGATTCMAPGAGQLGDPCPCDAGYVCSKLTNQCRKLCRLGNDATDCPNGGKCEGGSTAYPVGYGVCIAGNTQAY
jgi:hypothetical protein